MRAIWKPFDAFLCVACLALATTAAAAPNPDQERTALIRFLQKRLPGSAPADWSAGISANVPGVNAIPLAPEYSTNAADVLAIGKKLWDRPFANGKSLAKCFANGGKGLAAAYPQFDAKTQRLTTLEMAVNDCRTAQDEKPIEASDTGIMGPLLAYARSLSTGQKLNIRVSGAAALERYEAGKTWFQRRLGAQAYACVSCHISHAGAILDESDGKRVLPPAAGPAASWPRVQPGGTIRTLQMQIQRCMLRAGAEPLPLGADEMNELEYYLAFLSQGLPLLPLSTTK